VLVDSHAATLIGWVVGWVLISFIIQFLHMMCMGFGWLGMRIH